MFSVHGGIVLVYWKDCWMMQEANSSWQVQTVKLQGLKVNVVLCETNTLPWALSSQVEGDTPRNCWQILAYLH